MMQNETNKFPNFQEEEEKKQQPTNRCFALILTLHFKSEHYVCLYPLAQL